MCENYFKKNHFCVTKIVSIINSEPWPIILLIIIVMYLGKNVESIN